MSNGLHESGAAISALSVEMQALILGLRGIPPVETPRWDPVQLCELALAHGVAPLLHRAWAPFKDDIPEALFSDLSVLRRQSQKQGLLGLRQRDEVVQLLRQADLEPIVLKGAAWARRWYVDVSLRPFNDIDLLVSVQSLPRAREALLSAGYHDTGAWGASHHEMPLEHPERQCVIELHRSLLALPASRPVTFEDVAQRSITLEGKDAVVRTLDHEDTLLHLCIHLLQHVESEPGWRLLNVWDIVQHLGSHQVRWDVFGTRASEAGITAACSAALGLVAELTQVEIPAQFRDATSGRLLAEFPMKRYSLAPVHHRGMLSLIEAISRPRQWRDLPATIAAWLRRRAPMQGKMTTLEETSCVDVGGSPLRYVSRELWWILREGIRVRGGTIQQGVRQLRWEEDARRTVYNLFPGASPAQPGASNVGLHRVGKPS